jgi:hypothetical protein
MTFKMNPAAQAAMAAMAIKAVQGRFQPILDGLTQEFGGQPVAVVKEVLTQRWAAGNEGASIGDPQLTNWATAISEGRRVVLTADELSALS